MAVAVGVGKLQQFSEEELKVEESLGYPKAYAKLCRNHYLLKPYSKGPPFSFLPYSLQPQEALRVKDMNQMFPIIDPEDYPSANPRNYANLLWKQLDHLGNAGFDPALFRVDPFGNVLYVHADSGSPLAWDIDHWFPCSRGGKTVPSNLRLLQWQACEKKKNKLEFLVPWWDLQLGISVNQFLSIFASKNSDFRSRAFSFLFSDGGNEELHSFQTVESHAFPQSFVELKGQIGLAPAAVVLQGSSDASVLKPLDINRASRPASPVVGGRKPLAEEGGAPSMALQKFKAGIVKENNDPQMACYNTNPYLSITMARDSLRQREETKKKQEEITHLESELEQVKHSNEAERMALQDLEAQLIRKRRRVEKCRRLAEAQASYRALLEKMIRDAMHQAVVYKEQVRLNQVATSALKARLETQREMCESSEKELYRRYKQRNEVEEQMHPHWLARKRSRRDYTLGEERLERLFMSRTDDPIRKELRQFLEEEHKASLAGSSPILEEDSLDSSNAIDEETHENFSKALPLTKEDEQHNNSPRIRISIGGDMCLSTDKLKKCIIGKSIDNEENRIMMFNDVKSQDRNLRMATEHGQCSKSSDQIKKAEKQRPAFVAKEETAMSSKLSKLHISEPQKAKNYEANINLLSVSSAKDEDEEQRNKQGEQNVEKWLKLMLDNTSSWDSPLQNSKKTEERGCDLNGRRKTMHDTSQEIVADNTNAIKGFWGRKSFEKEVNRKEKKGENIRTESSRGFRSLPSSPSMILGMKKGVDCIGRKPKVIGDDDYETRYDESANTKNSKFLKAWTRSGVKLVNRF